MTSDLENALRIPTFLVGSERSGTTLLRLMLDHHPQISFNPEFEYSVSQMADDGTPPDMDAYFRFLETDFIFPGAKFAVDSALPYGELMHDFLRQKLSRDGKQFIGATVHHHFHRLLHLWPQARFIHLLRDPRDVASSVIGMGWAGNVWVGANRWVEAEMIWESMLPQLTEDRFIEVVYEDLIRDPPLHLARICDFMGTKYDAVMLDYHLHSTYSPADPKLVFQWRKKLAKEDIALVETKCGGLLMDRGYEHSGLPKREVSPAEVERLEEESQRLARRFLIKRYGLPLLLGAKIARTLRLTGLADHLQMKMNIITEKYIK